MRFFLAFGLLACLLNSKVLSTPLVFKFDRSSAPSHSDSENEVDKLRMRYDHLQEVPVPVEPKHPEAFGDSQSEIKDAIEDESGSCGYQACDLGHPDLVNVHLVPHTHDDVGWLKTVDQYFYGSKNNIQHAGVQYILDSVLEALLSDPKHRFIYVEIAFFARWWRELHDSSRHVVKKLVNEGRLEFILGGWCMNDEASTHYNAIIDQHTLGFDFLRETFGECARPKIGWQIDPFGHSREQASLFAQFGFDGLFFGRLDYQDKDKRLNDKTMEMMWAASDSLGLNQAGLFTGVNYNGYGPPDGFCFDRGCADEPIMDDDRLEDYNVLPRVVDFIKAVHDQTKHYTTNHIMMTMGSDFQFENAHQNFKNLDKLIKYVNDQQQQSDSKINLIYSTPSCYLYALNKANQTYSVKKDDFFPYANEAHSFWTGYFTSRPALKGYVRNTNNLLQVCKQLNILARKSSFVQPDQRLRVLMEAMGVAQHHDAVSGTEKQAVAFDYAKRLARGVAACQIVIQEAYDQLLPINSGDKAPVQEFCPLANVSSCSALEDVNSFTVVAYNPVGRSGNYNFRVPVNGSAFIVSDAAGNTIPSQVVNVTAATEAIPEYQKNTSTISADLVFQGKLPALGFATFFVQKKKGKEAPTPQAKWTAPTTDFSIQNEFTSLTFDGATGLLKSMTNMEKSLTIPLTQTILFYKGFKGNNSEPQFRASGAYVFRSNGSEAELISDKATINFVKGGVVQEIQQSFGGWASQVIRLYAGKREVEIEFTIGPIPIDDGIGKEVISRFTSNIASEGVFYTDSNGREMLKRVRDYRPTWNLNQTEPVAGNYYPVNSRIYIKDEKSSNVQLTILTDRSQGGSSLVDGEIELMLHRRLLVDDAFGAGEALNETGVGGQGLVVRGKHVLILDSVVDSPRRHRDLAERLFMSPQVTYAENSLAPNDYNKKYKTMWTAMVSELPDNVHLLTLEQREGTQYLLRLEHFYEEGEDEQLSKPATLNIADLFKGMTVLSVDEYALGADRLLAEVQRLEWNIEGVGRTNGRMVDFVTPVLEGPGLFQVELKPMQIRTFVIGVA